MVLCWTGSTIVLLGKQGDEDLNISDLRMLTTMILAMRLTQKEAFLVP